MIMICSYNMLVKFRLQEYWSLSEIIVSYCYNSAEKIGID